MAKAKETPDSILEKIKKLLARSANNPFEAEAQTCLLKAHKLMAEYNIHLEEVNDKAAIKYAELVCETKWNMGFRKPLANAIADNFRCKIYITGEGQVVFFGRDFDARVAKEAFEYAYDFALREGNRLYNKAYAAGCKTRGVFNSYTLGFVKGIKTKLEEQSTALVVTTPKDVVDGYETLTANWKTKTSKLRIANKDIDLNSYQKGVEDGKTVMNSRRLE